MPKLNPISFDKLVKRLKQFGFEEPYSGGKHLYMVRGNPRLTIPNPHKKEIGAELLVKILKQADITREEWLNKE